MGGNSISNFGEAKEKAEEIIQQNKKKIEKADKMIKFYTALIAQCDRKAEELMSKQQEQQARLWLKKKINLVKKREDIIMEKEMVEQEKILKEFTEKQRLLFRDEEDLTEKKKERKNSWFFAVFGVVSYLYFFWSFSASIFWRMNGCSWLPKPISFLFPFSIDDPNNLGKNVDFHQVVFNSLLLLAFSVHHSLFARKFMKKLVVQLGCNKTVERSLYVFVASFLLHLLIAKWKTIGGGYLWDFVEKKDTPKVYLGCLTGDMIALLSTFLVSHTELFGLSQSITGKFSKSKIVQPFPMKYIRHPIYLGFLMSFWLVPSMSYNRLLFSFGASVYTVCGTLLEEKDLKKELKGYGKFLKDVPSRYIPHLV